MMMDFRKPSKQRANELYLQSLGLKVNPYPEEAVEPTKSFLIITEGKNTEPGYFYGFPVPSKTVLVIGGKGSKNALVDYAIEEMKKEQHAGREVWCVYDMDIKPDEADTQPDDFNSSIKKASGYGIRVAWSNDAFELWFILHYQYLDAKLTRAELYPILKEKWGLASIDDAKKEEFCLSIYEKLGGSKSKQQANAIKYARTLHEPVKEKEDYANHCPCTTVYELVEELNKYLIK